MTQASSPSPPLTAGAVPAEARRDAEAAVAAHQELGHEYDEHIAAGLADRVEQLVAYRTAELRQTQDRDQQGSSIDQVRQGHRVLLGVWSVVAGIPITAIATANGGVVETAICWAGLVGVNVAQALGGRRR